MARRVKIKTSGETPERITARLNWRGCDRIRRRERKRLARIETLFGKSVMKILVLGAGRMGYGAAFDLVHSPGVDEVTVADIDWARAQRVAAQLGSARVKPVQIDVADHARVVDLMWGHCAAISCVDYRQNLALARA